MDIDKLTLGEAKRLAAMLGGMKSDDSHWQVGKTYFIRTVTHHLVGDLVKVTDKELVLKDAAWIADDGRLGDTIKTLNFNEVEPFPVGAEIIVGRSALIDAIIINKKDWVQR